MMGVFQILRTSTANAAPAAGSLLPGALAVEMASAAPRLWVGTPAALGYTGNMRLVIDSATIPSLPLSLANGGTNATDAAGARTQLGITQANLGGPFLPLTGGTLSGPGNLVVNYLTVGGLGVQYSGITGGTNNNISFRWTATQLEYGIDNVVFRQIMTTNDFPLSPTAPTDGQMLAWNSTASQWRPISLAGVEIYSGDDPPLSPQLNDLWYDSLNQQLKQWNGSIWVNTTAEITGFLPLAGGDVTGSIGVGWSRPAGLWFGSLLVPRLTVQGISFNGYYALGAVYRYLLTGRPFMRIIDNQCDIAANGTTGAVVDPMGTAWRAFYKGNLAGAPRVSLQAPDMLEVGGTQNLGINVGGGGALTSPFIIGNGLVPNFLVNAYRHTDGTDRYLTAADYAARFGLQGGATGNFIVELPTAGGAANATITWRRALTLGLNGTTTLPGSLVSTADTGYLNFPGAQTDFNIFNTVVPQGGNIAAQNVTAGRGGAFYLNTYRNATGVEVTASVAEYNARISLQAGAGAMYFDVLGPSAPATAGAAVGAWQTAMILVRNAQVGANQTNMFIQRARATGGPAIVRVTVDATTGNLMAV